MFNYEVVYAELKKVYAKTEAEAQKAREAEATCANTAKLANQYWRFAEEAYEKHPSDALDKICDDRMKRAEEAEEILGDAIKIRKALEKAAAAYKKAIEVTEELERMGL